MVGDLTVVFGSLDPPAEKTCERLIDLPLETDEDNASALPRSGFRNKDRMRQDKAWRACGVAGRTSTQVRVPSDIHTNPFHQLTSPDVASTSRYSVWVWDVFHIDDLQVPLIPVRLPLVKLFLELSLFDPALLTLKGIMTSDDLGAEAWYLEGWTPYLMAELAHDSPDRKLEGPGLT